MALGVRPRLLALRPLPFGAQVAVIGVLLGIAAVSIAPLFTLRRMRRRDIPSTLRLVE